MFITLQPFASKHKPQTFSRVCLRLKRRVYCWKRECYRIANAAAILGVQSLSCFEMENYTLVVIQSTTLLVLFLQTLTWTGTYSVDEVCNFPCQNMTVTPKLQPCLHLYNTHVSNGKHAV